MPDILIGTTDYTRTVYIPDPASTDGSGKTGLVAANLTVSYTRVETDNDVVVTDVTSSLNNLASLTAAHNDWGILEVSSTLAPGLYRLDIADAVFASGAWSAVVYVMITSSAAAASPIGFELVAFNKIDGVRLGLTALPNAAADAAGGLPISDAGGLDLDAKIGALTFTVANKVDANTTHAAGTAWNSGAIGAATLASDTIAAAKIAADAITAAKIADGAIDAATFAAGAINAAAIAADAITAAKVADGAIDAATFAAGAINAAAIAADAITAAKIADGAIDAATFATGAITADAIAADAIGSSELAASAVTEIQSGLSTLDAAGIRTAVGLASANLDTQLSGIQSDTNDIQTRLPAALVSGRMASDMIALSGSTTAADNLEAGADALVVSTCAAGSTTTSIVTNLTEATDDHYNGRVITFTSGALADQSSSISDYNGTTKTLTVVALTEAPADTDAFLIS